MALGAPIRFLARFGLALKGMVSTYTRSDGVVVHGYDRAGGQLGLFGEDFSPKPRKARAPKPTQLGLFAQDGEHRAPETRPSARPTTRETREQKSSRHEAAMRHLFSARHHERQADEARAAAFVARGRGDRSAEATHQGQADHHQAVASDHRARAAEHIKASGDSAEAKIHRAALEAHDHILRAATTNRIIWKDRTMVHMDKKGNYQGRHAQVHARVKAAAAQAIAEHHDGLGDLSTRLKEVAHEAAHDD